MIFLFLLSCYGDVSVIGLDDKNTDTYEDPVVPADTTGGSTGGTDGNVFDNGYGGYFHIYLRQVACPSCFGLSRELDVSIEFLSYNPITDLNSSWVPVSGDCTDNFFYTETSTNRVDLGQVSVSNGYQDFFLNRVSAGEYYSEIYESQYLRNTKHDVFVNNEIAFSSTSVEGFDWIEPYTMLWVDPSYAFETPISKQGNYFTWSPARQNSIFNVTIAVYSADGSSMLGSASCSGPDNGSLYFPGQLLDRYPRGSLAAIHLTRHEIEYIPSQYLNSYVESHMEWEVVGTGIIGN